MTSDDTPAGFAVIPVIDLMGGLVVHARAGERDRYRPLEGSRVTSSADPLAVVEGLLGLHPFTALYIADLDAIRKTGGHIGVLHALKEAFPRLDLWVDAGFSDPAASRAFLDLAVGRLVLGSESQSDLGLLESLRDEPSLVLSLDFKGGERLGPPSLFDRRELWPETVIVMTLAQVGTGKGPDLERLGAIRAQAPGKRIIAAGGVRDAKDLMALRALGCAGVLVASALHDGRLGPEDLARLAG
jgi:phosphoribosylformimino-5-aminoimidazole carboxamide ribotide isomerase